MKIVTIVGARPQFIKAAAVSLAIEKYKQNRDAELTEVLVHTGQHYDHNMSDVFFEQLSIPIPQYNLEIGSGSHGLMTGSMLIKIEEVLFEEQPDFILVYGDTNSTLAGALAGAKLHIPVAHVEAGLRSYNRRMPEEINRIVTDQISDILFCPTVTAVSNLSREGIVNGVKNVGDVMYDAFLNFQKIAIDKATILSDLNIEPRSYYLSTVHRQENTDNPSRLSAIFSTFQEIASKDLSVIAPVHPRTLKFLERHNIKIDSNTGLQIIPPVSYLDMIALESSAKLIFTDSGGMQKEAYFAGVPCVTLRDETEWKETVEIGSNFIAGANRDTILRAFEMALKAKVQPGDGPYGNGKASELIVKHLTSSE